MPFSPTAPISDVAVANFAVGIFDDYPLSSLDDDTSVGRFMARHYAYVRDELLQTYPASFARKRDQIAATGTAPAFGWKYAYTLPTDCLRLLPLTYRGLLNGVRIPYELEGRTILTDQIGPLNIRYIRKVVNAAEFTPLFARLLGSRLAILAATRITGKSSYFDKARGAYQEALADYMKEDSLSAGTPEQYEWGGDDSNTQYSPHDVRGVGL